MRSNSTDLSVAMAAASVAFSSRVRKGVRSIFVVVSETVGYCYFGAKRTVFGFLSITLANSFTGPYVMQPA